MPKRVDLRLSESERITLGQMRDHHVKAYMRERASALLKVADGMSIKNVAATGLLQERDEDTVSRWVRRYRSDGLVGLYLKPGRGRKPAFFPPESSASASDGS